MPDSKSTPAISQAVTSASGLVSEPRPKKMLDQVPDAIRRKHYCPRTEESHANWIKRFIRCQQSKSVRHAKPEQLRLVTRRGWPEAASR